MLEKESVYKNTGLCARCKVCREVCESPVPKTVMPVCPSGMTYKFDSYYGSGRVTIARKYMEGVFEYNDSLAKLVYSCTLCGACHVQCPIMGFDPVEVTRYLREEAVGKGFADKFYSLPEGQRLKYESQADSDVGLLVGCTNSGDEALVKNVADLLTAAGIKFKTVSFSTGGFLKRKGDEDAFAKVREQTTADLNAAGIKKLIVYSPLAYSTLLSHYELGGLEVVFYLDCLTDIPFKALPAAKKAAYHDPSYLGRFTNYHDAPRQVLGKIGNMELVEFKRTKENTLCSSALPDCDEKIVAEVSSQRLAEAADLGVEMIVTSCWNCKNTLNKQAEAENSPILAVEMAELLVGLL